MQAWGIVKNANASGRTVIVEHLNQYTSYTFIVVAVRGGVEGVLSESR